MSTSAPDSLLKEIKSIKSLKLVQMFQSPSKLFWINFFIGVARGLGTLAGVSIFLALFVFILSFLQDIPVIGGFFSEILYYIDSIKYSR